MFINIINIINHFSIIKDILYKIPLTAKQAYLKCMLIFLLYYNLQISLYTCLIERVCINLAIGIYESLVN